MAIPEKQIVKFEQKNIYFTGSWKNNLMFVIV